MRTWADPLISAAVAYYAALDTNGRPSDPGPDGTHGFDAVIPADCRKVRADMRLMVTTIVDAQSQWRLGAEYQSVLRRIRRPTSQVLAWRVQARFFDLLEIQEWDDDRGVDTWHDAIYVAERLAEHYGGYPETEHYDDLACRFIGACRGTRHIPPHLLIGES